MKIQQDSNFNELKSQIAHLQQTLENNKAKEAAVELNILRIDNERKTDTKTIQEIKETFEKSSKEVVISVNNELKKDVYSRFQNTERDMKYIFDDWQKRFGELELKFVSAQKQIKGFKVEIDELTPLIGQTVERLIIENEDKQRIHQQERKEFEEKEKKRFEEGDAEKKIVEQKKSSELLIICKEIEKKLKNSKSLTESYIMKLTICPVQDRESIQNTLQSFIEFIQII